MCSEKRLRGNLDDNLKFLLQNFYQFFRMFFSLLKQKNSKQEEILVKKLQGKTISNQIRRLDRDMNLNKTL